MTEPTPEQTQDKATVLVVDDDQVLRRQLFWALDSEHHVLEADSRPAAIAQLQSGRVGVVLCDLHLPPDLDGISGGLAIIEAARSARPSIPVIVITGSNSRQTALEAIRCGAYGFFEKPFNEDEVTHIVRQAARVRRLEAENLKLRASLGSFRGFGRLLGSSPALERIMKQARAVASTSATVLLTGEN
ncbi:MAG TPA: response regulator, partial [Pyrinomonadaceae bacterium]